MSGNGRGATRAQGRSPPFLVIGLLVALAILAFSYWNLSASNASLSVTNIDLQDQIRILSSKRLSEEQGKRDVERKYGLLEQRIASKDSEIKHLQEEADKKQSDVDKAEGVKKECTVNLQTCETNNSGIQQQLGEVNQQLEELKNKQVTTKNCESECKEAMHKLYAEMYPKVGVSVMQQLINAGLDVGDDLKTKVQEAATGGDKKQIDPPNPKEQSETKDPKSDTPQDPKQPEAKDGQDAGKTTTAPGIVNKIVGLKDKLKESVQSISQDTLSQDALKQKLQSLSEQSGVNLHEILNKTQEGIKQGLKKSQQLSGLMYGDGNMHANRTDAGQNDKNNATLTGDTKQDNNLIKDDSVKPKENVKEMDTTEKKTDKALVKDDENDDTVYDDDDDDEANKDKVEDIKKPNDMKKEEDSIDALGKNLNKESQ